MYFFPAPYPSELMYSTLARFHALSGNAKSIYTIEDLYGSRNAIANLEFPSKLKKLVQLLPPGSLIDAEQLIDHNSLLNYYGAFKNCETIEYVIQKMLNSDCKGVSMKLGLVASGISFHKHLRFCPSCFLYDMENYGEAYWHREHQIAGVFMCHIHKEMTQDSTFLSRGGNRQVFHLATLDCCTKNASSDDIDKKFHEHLLRFAKDTAYLCQTRTTHSQMWLKNRIRVLLYKKNYARQNNYIHIKKLKEDFIKYYSEEYLQLMNNATKTMNWLEDMVRFNGKSHDTGKYILLIEFLCDSVEEFFDSEVDLDKIDVSKYLQGLWDERLKELIELDISQRELCGVLGSIRMTVVKAMKRLGIEKSWKSNGGSRYNDVAYPLTQEYQAMKNDMERKWLELQALYPNLSTNQLRKKSDHTYAWLKKYHEEWLQQQQSYEIPKGSNVRNNWAEKDKELLVSVTNVVKEFDSGKPKRITWGTVSGKLGITGWFYKMRNQIPLTKAYMEEAVESLENYQIRKLSWAISELEKENKSITKFNILEKAGVKERYLKNIRDEVLEICNKFDLNESILIKNGKDDVNVLI